MMNFVWLSFLPGATAFVIQDSPNSNVDASVPSNCTAFAVTSSGDTCTGIEWYFNITQAEFSTWNPSLKSDCSGLSTSNYSYCAQILQPPSSDDYTYTKPDPTATATSEGGYSPTQTGIPSNCDSYYYVNQSDTCQGIVDGYGGLFSLEDFYDWNPAVGKDCSHLFAGYFVCIGLTTSPTEVPTTASSASATATGPLPEQTGIPSNCSSYYLVQPGDGCQSIADKNGIKLSDFYSWNPAVQSDCSKLFLGYYVCVGVPNYAYATTTSTSSTAPTKTTSTSMAPSGLATPSPVQSGIAKNCGAYYKAVSGDYCYAISSKFGNFTVDQFEGWNPAVGSDCSHLFVDYYYCIGVSQS